MSSVPHTQSQGPDSQSVPETTVSFDTFSAESPLPETTLAFDTGFSEVPEVTHYPAVVNYEAREEVGRGGGWEGGSLAQFRIACAYFASRGLVCATAEYQMLSKAYIAKLPVVQARKRVCVTDAKSAIRWFKQHAGELGIDPQRIITGGGSAGGHISALATMNPGLNDPADPEGIDTSVVAYLWFNPAFANGGDDEHDPEIDVLRHLKADLPPAITFFGDKDGSKPGWDIVHAKWISLGTTPIDLQIAPGQTHSFFNNGPWQTVTLIAADQFLIKQGFLAGAPTKTMPETGEKLVPAQP